MEKRSKCPNLRNILLLTPHLAVSVFTEYGYGTVNYTKYKQVLDFPVEKLQLAEDVPEEQKKNEIEQHR